MNKAILPLLLILVSTTGLYAFKKGELEIKEGEPLPKKLTDSTYFIMIETKQPGFVQYKWCTFTKNEVERIKKHLADVDRSKVIDDELIGRFEHPKKGKPHKHVVHILKDHKGQTVGEVLDMLKSKVKGHDSSEPMTTTMEEASE